MDGQSKQQASAFKKADRVRNAKLKQLFLYVTGIRDLWSVESFYKDLKDLPINDITSIENHAKAIAFVVCYGRIFNESEGVGIIKTRDFLKKLSNDEKEMHGFLKKVRNSLYAHVDPQHTHMFVNFNEPNKPLVHAQDIYHIYKGTHKITLSLLGKLRSYLEMMRDKLSLELYKGKTRSQIIVYKEVFCEREITDKG